MWIAQLSLALRSPTVFGLSLCFDDRYTCSFPTQLFHSPFPRLKLNEILHFWARIPAQSSLDSSKFSFGSSPIRLSSKSFNQSPRVLGTSHMCYGITSPRILFFLWGFCWDDGAIALNASSKIIARWASCGALYLEIISNRWLCGYFCWASSPLCPTFLPQAR